MTREEKLEAIYKEMANKELNLGCKVRFDKGIYTIIDGKNVGFLDSYREKDGNIHNTIVIEDGVNSRCYSIEEIIGHPVMIGDVLDWVDEHNKSVRTWMLKYEKVIVYFGWNKKEPIDKQSDECIDYVYSLIQKN